MATNPPVLNFTRQHGVNPPDLNFTSLGAIFDLQLKTIVRLPYWKA